MPKIATGTLPESLRPLWEEWNDYGPDHPEIRRRQQETRTIAAENSSLVQLDYWKFVDDAIRGVGGFLDGSYIFPHPREFQKQTFSLTPKALERIEQSTYDNFAGVIAEAPWIQIARAADMIKRDSQGNPDLDEFWDDVDGRGTAILDFLQFPFLQARAYGTAFVRVDRPATELSTERQDKAVPVILRAYPTSAFKWWKLSIDGELTSLVYCLELSGYEAPAIYVWDLESFAVLLPVDSKATEQYSLERWGTNPLADEEQLPFCRLHDIRPTYGEALGQSIMLNVAKLARSVYNTDSRIEELESKTAFPFLGLPVANGQFDSVSKLQLGTAIALPYDSGGGAPAWVAPELEAMTVLAARRDRAVDQAYGMAHMSALKSYQDGKTVQTNSGYHAEMEMDKTNTRIASCAAALEVFESRLIDLWAMFRGVTFKDNPTVEYPRDYGIRDMDKVFERTKMRLEMNLGDDDTVECLRDFYEALYPRTPADEIEALAQAGAKAKAEARAAEQKLKEAQAQQQPTPMDRAKQLMQKNRTRAA